MTEIELRPYDKLYFNPRYMGAADLFRRFYGLTPDTIVPLSVSHGVDYGQSHNPLDVDSIEPVHWSCNSFMHQSASVLKPSILLPHPWFMNNQDMPVPHGKGVLVIGPPPSPANDAALYELIRKDVRSDWSILVKARGAYQGSMRYWAERGLKPLTASGPDSNFYQRLFNLLSQYETIIGCTFSSALVFAASIGKQIELVQGFTLTAYQPSDMEAEINLHSSRASSVVKTFLKRDQSFIQDLSRELLGFEQARDKMKNMREFQDVIAQLRRPFWNDRRLGLPYALREVVAMRLGKPRILKASLVNYIQHFKRTNTCIVTMNELDIWLNGKNATNFSLKPIKHLPGITEHGIAPMGYMI
jgi:hypothetical protein